MKKTILACFAIVLALFMVACDPETATSGIPLNAPIWAQGKWSPTEDNFLTTSSVEVSSDSFSINTGLVGTISTEGGTVIVTSNGNRVPEAGSVWSVVLDNVAISTGNNTSIVNGVYLFISFDSDSSVLSVNVNIPDFPLMDMILNFTENNSSL